MLFRVRITFICYFWYHGLSSSLLYDSLLLEKKSKLQAACQFVEEFALHILIYYCCRKLKPLEYLYDIDCNFAKALDLDLQIVNIYALPMGNTDCGIAPNILINPF